jgi:hypothetical protein
MPQLPLAPTARAKIVTPTQPDSARATDHRSALVRLSLLEQRRVTILKVVQFLAFDLLADEPLDRIHVYGILSDHQREGIT